MYHTFESLLQVWLFDMKKRILKNSKVKNISRFVSLKTDSVQTTESDLEFDACFHFEFAPQIKTFETQPLGFKYRMNGRLRRYTPDMLCYFNDGYAPYYEVKPKWITEQDEFKEKFDAQRQQAISNGHDLLVLTENDIQIYSLLDNLKIIHRYACSDNLDDVQVRLLKLFQNYGEMRISQVLNANQAPSTTILPALYDLIAKKILEFDWHCPISHDSLVWRVS
ncbi:heteromeric transposase endonuclease subunit TnsA [Vibrio parahaemolyticus]|nr:heteromeric transposase endonuclease subunit TnsA [Vibrio parahaemolyticus]EGQ8988054.1 heteromeric transposase endonuclease subunit TnsA [Vibrio parahaemolyticus]EGQ9007334.1 heteromeric transposase endonuclease subunit TnsA [Vibrio parahaemolyticus]EGR2869203.1 heteromeric transposase endonuclease subunit TnsA [Vibrio parahaemolyticus]EGR2897101.1 heteromeric transposase endonuclease subunit TnsA [Vibrio parahaemolyticus]